MSDARVELTNGRGEPAGEHEKPERFTFRCPVHNRGRDPEKRTNVCPDLLIAAGPHSAAHGIKRDPQSKNGGHAQWDWDGNRQAPTFAPSIRCSGCGWHGYIRAGRCVDTSGREEPD
ncbi:hypothetical protein GC209_19245 [bacterium]|nr:hypothetical protein [bacterium]